MGSTDRFRAQHEELLGIAKEITAQLSVATLSQDASVARGLLSKLIGGLKVHLAAEDKSLYPRLINSADEEVSQLATEFMEEMGSIAEAVLAYSGKWQSAAKIQDDAATFINETQDLFGALANRIDRENNQLYPMMDAQG